VENINITEQLDKIKNLIEAKHAALISEQTDPRQVADSIYRELWKARNNSDELVRVISKINSLQVYNGVNGLLAKNVPADSNSIVKILNKELGFRDVVNANKIKQSLAKIGKNITFNLSGDNSVESDSIKVVGTAAPNTPATVSPMEREQYWKTTFSCVTKQPGAKASTLKDGTTAYNIGGIFYYNNGRKKLADGTMANYSCNTEFKSNANTQQRRVKRNSGLSQRFSKSTQSLGIQNGKMDVDTLQKILASLEGTAPKAKTANDFLPQGVPADAFNQQLPPDDTNKGTTNPPLVEV
jgi:hypothetical protein